MRLPNTSPILNILFDIGKIRQSRKIKWWRVLKFCILQKEHLGSESNQRQKILGAREFAPRTISESSKEKDMREDRIEVKLGDIDHLHLIRLEWLKDGAQVRMC